MSEKYKANTDYPYFVTMTVQGWIDLFTRYDYIEIVLDSLRYCHQNKGLIIHEYVIMSNHIHLIIQHDEALLPGVIRDLKRHMAKQIIRTLETNTSESRREWILRMFVYYAKYLNQNTKYAIWRKTNRPIELSDPEKYGRCRDYIHQNPVKAQLVSEPHYWLHSSACEENLLKDILEMRSGDT